MKHISNRLSALSDLFRSLWRRDCRAKIDEPYPRGHFYSPLPDLADVERRAQVLFARDVNVEPAIRLRSEEQLALFRQMAQFYPDFDRPVQPRLDRRFYVPNGWFDQADAISLYLILRHFRPKRVIEIGSGFSSALMLDTNEQFLNRSAHVMFIEPHPERLLALMRQKDLQHAEILEDIVQNVPIKIFAELDQMTFCLLIPLTYRKSETTSIFLLSTYYHE